MNVFREIAEPFHVVAEVREHTSHNRRVFQLYLCAISLSLSPMATPLPDRIADSRPDNDLIASSTIWICKTPVLHCQCLRLPLDHPYNFWNASAFIPFASRLPGHPAFLDRMGHRTRRKATQQHPRGVTGSVGMILLTTEIRNREETPSHKRHKSLQSLVKRGNSREGGTAAIGHKRPLKIFCNIFQLSYTASKSSILAARSN
jgi:hypothetical protein